MSWFRWRSCESKIRYAKRGAAAIAARHLTKKKGYRARAYGPCEFCRGFHAGHVLIEKRDRRR